MTTSIIPRLNFVEIHLVLRSCLCHTLQISLCMKHSSEFHNLFQYKVSNRRKNGLFHR